MLKVTEWHETAHNELAEAATETKQAGIELRSKATQGNNIEEIGAEFRDSRMDGYITNLTKIVGPIELNMFGVQEKIDSFTSSLQTAHELMIKFGLSLWDWNRGFGSPAKSALLGPTNDNNIDNDKSKPVNMFQLKAVMRFSKDQSQILLTQALRNIQFCMNIDYYSLFIKNQDMKEEVESLKSQGKSRDLFLQELKSQGDNNEKSVEDQFKTFYKKKFGWQYICVYIFVCVCICPLYAVYFDVDSTKIQAVGAAFLARQTIFSSQATEGNVKTNEETDDAEKTENKADVKKTADDANKKADDADADAQAIPDQQEVVLEAAAPVQEQAQEFEEIADVQVAAPVQEPVEEVIEAIQEPVEEVTEAIQEPVEEATEAIQEPVEEVTEAIQEQPKEEVQAPVQEQVVVEEAVAQDLKIYNYIVGGGDHSYLFDGDHTNYLFEEDDHNNLFDEDHQDL